MGLDGVSSSKRIFRNAPSMTQSQWGGRGASLLGFTVCPSHGATALRGRQSGCVLPEDQRLCRTALGDCWATAQRVTMMSPTPQQIVWVPHAHLSTGGKSKGVAYSHFCSEKAVLIPSKK